MSSFLEEVKAATEQRQKTEKEAKEAAEKLEGRVETLDEIVETVYAVIRERLLRKLKEGKILKETVVKSNGLFKPTTTTKVEYVYVSVNMDFMDGTYLAVRHIETTDTDEFDEVYCIYDRFRIRLIERDQLSTLKKMLGEKLHADNIKYQFNWIKCPDKKVEEKRKNIIIRKVIFGQK